MPSNGPTKAELQAELEQLRNTVHLIQTQFQSFKQDVREVAIDAASTEGWCKSGLNEALEALGLPKVQDKYLVTASLEVVFEVELGDTSAEDFDPESTLNSSLNLEVSSWNDEWGVNDLSVVNVDWEEHED